MNKAIPVFVFLDENMPEAQAKTFDKLTNQGPYEIRAIPFPPLFKSLGIFDFQVVLFIKKAILSGDYQIGKHLSSEPAPIFIFLTSDNGFLEDARTGLNDQDSLHQKKYLQHISFDGDMVRFKCGEKKIRLHVCNIRTKAKDGRGSLRAKMIQAVRDVLITYPLAP